MMFTHKNYYYYENYPNPILILHVILISYFNSNHSNNSFTHNNATFPLKLDIKDRFVGRNK